MECDDTRIKCLIEKLIMLLQVNNEKVWAAIFQKFLHRFSLSENKSDLAKEIISIYKGGMGSFSDLVLQKDMKILHKENDQLAKLKNELFNACLNFCE